MPRQPRNPTRWVCSSLIWLLLILVWPVSGTFAQRASGPRSSSDFSALAAEADAARDANRLDEAVALYKKALALRPSWTEGWWSLGTIQYDRNSYAESARSFEKVISVAPKNGNAHVMLGLSEFELGRDGPALAHIDKGTSLGINKEPEFQHVVLYHEGVLLRRAGRFESARKMLEELCVQGVRSEEGVQELGLALLRVRGKSLPEAPNAAAVVPQVGRAACLSAEKKFDQARTELQPVVERYSDYPEIHYAYGLILLEGSEQAEAVAEFKKEIEKHPSDVVSRLQIAAASYKMNSSGGLPYAEEAVKLAPHEPFGHYLLGMLLLDVDDYQRAIPELEIAQRAFPKEARICLALGSAYSRAGRRQDAAREREMAKRIRERQGQTQEQPEGIPDGSIPVGDARSPE